MDLLIAKPDLSRVLSRAASIAATKSPSAALKCVLLDAVDGRLTVRATNLLLGIEASCAAGVKTPGTVAVDARRASEIAKNMPAGEVRMRLVKDQLEVSSVGGKAKFRLATVAPDLFPALPDSRDERTVSVTSIAAVDLARLIAQGSYAMANDETRPEQSATYFDVEPTGVRVFSTDRLRMATAFAACPCTATKMLIPGRGVQELKKLADGAKDSCISIHTLGSNAFFSVGDLTLVVKLNDDVYPPMRKLGETGLASVTHWVQLPRTQLIESIKRVALVPIEAGGKFSLVFTFSEGQLRISGAEGANEGEDFVPCDSTVDLEMELPHAFMEAACSVTSDDDVRIGISTARAPLMVTGATSIDECSGLVMPVAKTAK